MPRLLIFFVFFVCTHVVFAGNSRPVLPPMLVTAVPSNATTAHFDLLVYGNEPEAILAAVSAAELGLDVALITQEPALGGLYTQGWLNVLDLKTQPHDYQLGIFDTWWRQVGRSDAFDIPTAMHVFTDMLAAADVTVVLGSKPLAPVFTDEALAGLYVPETAELYEAAFFIDASADADFAAAAGAPFTIGWETFGVNLRMADTLVFSLEGVDWNRLTRHIRNRGSHYAVAKEHVAWGHFGGVPAAYEPSNTRFKLRGLNLGLQADGSVLVNALLIYDIDPLDEASLARGRVLATNEAHRVTAYLQEHIPGLERALVNAVAPELYVRESRHLQGLCTLTAEDVMYNRTGPFAIAAGGYPLDAQSFTPHDTGYVWATPGMFGGQLCMMTPPNIPNLFVAGRSGSFDPVAFSSGRIVPFGIAMAEGAAVAAAYAVTHNLSAQDVATGAEHITTIRETLRARGAYLPPVETNYEPLGPHDDPHYEAFVLMVSRGLALGGYDNNPRLHERVSSISFAYLLSNVATRFFYEPTTGEAIVDVLRSHLHIDDAAPLTAATAAALVEEAACLLGVCNELPALPELQDPAHLTRGETYALAAQLALLAPQ